MKPLSDLGLSAAEIKKLEKKTIETVEDVQFFFPRKYYDFTNPVPLSPKYNGMYVSVVGRFDQKDVDKKNNRILLKAKVYDRETGKKLNIMWIGSYYLNNIIKYWVGETVVVCGKLEYHEDYHSYHMNNPLIFDMDVSKHLSILPVYKKMSGISEEWMDGIIKLALADGVQEWVDNRILEQFKLPSLDKAVRELHKPSSADTLRKAQQRIVFDKMLRFAIGIEKKEREVSKGTVYNIKSTKGTEEFIKSLPFSLSESQMDVYRKMRDTGMAGLRINALVQGDVGSGKTMVAFLAMFMMADSGYQSVLMAPTEILARQHYKELKFLADKIGYKTVLLCSKTKQKEKKEIYKQIASGECQFVVGTQSVFADQIEYKSLALTVVDEEHKFGVRQQEELNEKAKMGCHMISMSATPIPRTVANTLYGTSTEIYTIERPAGRQEVQTAIFNNDQKIFEFIEKQIGDGRQCYVVCPLIEKNEDEDSKMAGIMSVAQTEEMYQKYFSKKGINVACVTGKTDPEESVEIISKFKEGQTDILISTTVIEVGVDVPNASVIVINNAERFGLAQLHQLRGRVGRGGYKGYCILKSANRGNERLNLVASTIDGFELAEADLQLRGPGEILGEEQSGRSKEIELILKYPNMYAKVREIARQLV